MKGFFESLTPDQQKAALAYRGEENHGDEAFKRDIAKAVSVAKANGATIHPRIAKIKAALPRR